MARGTAHSETYVYTAGFSAPGLCALVGTGVSKNAAAHANKHAKARPTRVRILSPPRFTCTRGKIWPNFVFEQAERNRLLRDATPATRACQADGQILTAQHRSQLEIL